MFDKKKQEYNVPFAKRTLFFIYFVCYFVIHASFLRVYSKFAASIFHYYVNGFIISKIIKYRGGNNV